MKSAINDWKFVVLCCLTLGLAPYFPLPHVVSKLVWVRDGAKGGDWLDWLDLLVHGIPWLLLLRLVALFCWKLTFGAKKEGPKI
jgi:hypothetical protein